MCVWGGWEGKTICQVHRSASTLVLFFALNVCLLCHFFTLFHVFQVLSDSCSLTFCHNVDLKGMNNYGSRSMQVKLFAQKSVKISNVYLIYLIVSTPIPTTKQMMILTRLTLALENRPAGSPSQWKYSLARLLALVSKMIEIRKCPKYALCGFPH